MIIESEKLTDAEARRDIKGNDRHHLAPVMRGSVYCSPWCGVHCKKASYDRAVTEADALAARLGNGWAPKVHENMGWYWAATKNASRVSPLARGDHVAGTYVVTGYMASVQVGRQFLSHAATPEDALGFAVHDARTFVQRMNEALLALQSQPPEPS